MKRVLATAILSVMAGVFGVRAASAQATTPLHDAQYPDVDIAYGANLYAARCVTCHGAQGDAIGGVNLRSGKFRNASTDNDLARFIRAGSPAAGMPPFALDNAEMAGIIAYLRNMNTFDTATREDRRRGARPRGLRRQGRLRRVSPRWPCRFARGAEPERHRIAAQPGLDAALARSTRAAR